MGDRDRAKHKEMAADAHKSGPVYAVDIGGSKLVTAIVSADGEVQSLRRREPAPLTPEALIEAIAQQYAEALEEAGPVAGCGVTIPGLADPRRGLWRHASFSGLRDWPVQAALAERLGLEVAIANDVDACALAEQRWGAAQGRRDFLWITLSNGVGGALVLDGSLYTGAGHAAGEIGHLKAVRGGIPCECGGRGCLEQYASGRAIARHYAQSGGTADGASAQEVARRALSGEPAAREAFALAGSHLGEVLADAIGLLNVPLVFFGGGVAQSFALMRDAVEGSLRTNLYAEANSLPEMRVTQLGYHAALLGAASVFLQPIHP